MILPEPKPPLPSNIALPKEVEGIVDTWIYEAGSEWGGGGWQVAKVGALEMRVDPRAWGLTESTVTIVVGYR